VLRARLSASVVVFDRVFEPELYYWKAMKSRGFAVSTQIQTCFGLVRAALAEVNLLREDDATMNS
jgi:hypothetical protein